MDNLYIQYLVLIISFFGADSKERIPSIKSYSYDEVTEDTKRPENSESYTFNSFLPTFKQPRFSTQVYPFRPKFNKHVSREYPLHDTSDNVEVFECPPGYRKRITGGVEFCTPTVAEHEILESKQPACKGSTLIKALGGWKCETQAKLTTYEAHIKQRQYNELKSNKYFGHENVNKPQCEEGKVAAMSQDGFICMDPVFPPSVCPEGQVPSMSSRGIQCVPCPYGQKVVHMEDGVKCEASGIRTTELPCPEGLQPIQTPIGRVCHFVQPTTRQVIKTCPNGLLKYVDGKMICETGVVCPTGEVKVLSNDGNERCITSQMNNGWPCSDGEISYEGACISIHLAEKFISDSKNPCTSGHFLVVSNTGSVCQQIIREYKTTSDTFTPCEPGTILSQTRERFQCVPGEIPLYVIPMCEQGFAVAKLGEMYECISRYDVDLTCSGNELIVRINDGFVCKEDIIETAQCGPDELSHIDENGRFTCISLDEATELCGSDYIAVRNGDSFLCKKRTEDVTCPTGYTLSLDHGKPLCVEEGADCINTPHLPPTGCLNLVPHCKQGYRLDVDSGIPHCALVTDQWRTDDVIQPCDADGSVRPCDLPADLLMSGCNPDCANGGTCVNATCLCPPGVTGHACHIDVDECEGRPCDYRCDNTFGSYQCVCPAGMLLNADGRTCSDGGCIPECLNNGVCVRGQCRCSSGFEGLYCQIDKDECIKYGDRLCQHRCRNTYGSYTCICPQGTRLNPDGRTCLNTTCIPECRNGGSCYSHRCQCPSGFYGIICQFDVNECRTEKPCDQRCVNSWGSYHCACNEGFKQHTDGHTCLSVFDTIE